MYNDELLGIKKMCPYGDTMHPGRHGTLANMDTKTCEHTN